MKKSITQKTLAPQTKKLSSTLLELEDALSKWDEISKDSSSIQKKRLSKHHSICDSAFIAETKKILSKLKIQIAELDI